MKTKYLLISFTLGLGLALSLLWLLGSVPATPALAQSGTGVIRVAITGSDVPGCGDESNPCATVQYAVDQALPGEEIRVATGVYTGVQARMGITQVVYISKTVTVRGGYSGDFTAWNPAVYTTTLDAQGLGRVLVLTGSITPTIEGLRLTGGDATGLGGDSRWGHDAGGGVYVITATATIRNNWVFSNTASTAVSLGLGGGLYLSYSNAMLQGNTVQGNTASTAFVGLGGGLYLFYSDATLEGNTVQGNTASTTHMGEGGGLNLYDSDATLKSNTVQGNTASTAGQGGGGGMCLEYGSATLQGNTVQGNIASTVSWGSGGGVYLYYSNAMLQDNTVVSNTASTAYGGYGGGLYLRYSNATLEGNMVQGNTAGTAYMGKGGGVYLYDSDTMLEGNAVQGNTANKADDGYGGGLYLVYGAATLEGNTVVSNTATLNQTATGAGGGLWMYLITPLTLTNNLVAGNHANTAGSGLWFVGLPYYSASGRLRHTTIADNHGSGQGVYVGSQTILVFTNTIIAGHSGVGITVTAGSTVTLGATLWHGNGADTGGGGMIFTGTVNVHDDPAFVNPVAGDYHLGIGSEAIDAGVDAGVTTDIDGDPRPWPPGGDHDIGADEFLPLRRIYLPLVLRSG